MKWNERLHQKITHPSNQTIWYTVGCSNRNICTSRPIGMGSIFFTTPKTNFQTKIKLFWRNIFLTKNLIKIRTRFFKCILTAYFHFYQSWYGIKMPLKKPIQADKCFSRNLFFCLLKYYNRKICGLAEQHLYIRFFGDLKNVCNGKMDVFLYKDSNDPVDIFGEAFADLLNKKTDKLLSGHFILQKRQSLGRKPK